MVRLLDLQNFGSTIDPTTDVTVSDEADNELLCLCNTPAKGLGHTVKLDTAKGCKVEGNKAIAGKHFE